MTIPISALIFFGVAIAIVCLVAGFLWGSWYGEKLLEPMIHELRTRHSWEIIQIHKKYNIAKGKEIEKNLNKERT